MAFTIKRNHNKVSNSVVRKIIKYIVYYIYQEGQLKRSTAFWSNGFSQ